MKRIAGLTLALLLSGCVAKLDTERVSVDDGSFGTTVVTLMCKRVAYLEDIADGDDVVDVRGDEYRDICRFGLAPPALAPATLKAYQAKRDILIGSVDAVFPDDGFLPDLQTFLTANDFLALYDDGTAIAAVDDLIELMHFMADDSEFAPALARLNHRLGYMPMTEAMGAVRVVVNYPEMHEFLLEVGDQITAGGQAKAEFDNLLEALGVTLRNAEEAADPAAADRTGALALDVLFSTNELLGTSRTIPMVRRDHRGLAKVAWIDGELALDFADIDADGFADIDDIGHFLDAGGNRLDAPVPFKLPDGDEETPWLFRDEVGRALESASGEFVYEYVDLDKTMFGALVRDSIQLFDPQKGTALDLLRGGSALMSGLPRELVTRTYDNGESLSYRGYDTAESPLLDMVYGYLQLLGDPNIDDTLALSRNLMVNNEAELARLLETIIDVAEIGDNYPNAEVPAGSPLWDDLMPVVRDIAAQPGLMEDLLRALEDPAVAELGLRIRDQMKFKDSFYFDADQNLVGSFSTPVDRGQNDAAMNRSLWQRLLHLINDSNYAVLCNKQNAQVKIIGIPIGTYDECDLLRIDNVALFYLQSIAYNKDAGGNLIYDDDGSIQRKARFPFNFNNALIEWAATDSLLQSMSTIDGFKHHPTPEALNRVLFLDPAPTFITDTMDPAKCKDGDYFYSAHAGTLPVWEADGFYDQIRPVLQPFADHDQEQLFLDVLAVLHKHWPSDHAIPTHQFSNPGLAGYAWGSGISTYEEIIVTALSRRETEPTQGNILDALVFGAPALNAATGNGKSFPTIVAAATRYLVTPQAGLTNRLGETSTVTSDGVEVPAFSPWQLLADGYAGKRARLEVAAAEGEAWQNATGNLADVLVRADPVPTVGWTFRNPRFRGLSVALIDFLRKRVAAHRAADDLDEWLGDELPTRTEEIMSGPVFAGAADFILSLQASPEARAQIEQLAAYLVNEVSYDETFRTSLTAIADTVQLGIDDRDIIPIARVAGEALKAEHGWVESHLNFVKLARHSDENQALVRMLRNLFTEYRPGHTAFADLIDGISEVHRARPYDDLGLDYAADDYRSLLSGLAQFLDDEKRGLRRFISIIEGRNL